jgi:hypothetical protein
VNARQIESVVVNLLNISGKGDLAREVRNGTNIVRTLERKDPSLVKTIRMMAALNAERVEESLTVEKVYVAIVSRRPELESVLRQPAGLAWLKSNVDYAKKVLRGSNR